MAAIWTTPTGVTASSILPYTHWNTYVRDNADWLYEKVTANSAGLTGLSGLYTGHTASPSGAHGLTAKAAPLGVMNATSFVLQSATAYITDTSVWVVWPQAFAAVPVVAAGYQGSRDHVVQILTNQPGSAEIALAGADATGTAHVLAFGKV